MNRGPKTTGSRCSCRCACGLTGGRAHVPHIHGVADRPAMCVFVRACVAFADDSAGGRILGTVMETASCQGCGIVEGYDALDGCSGAFEPEDDDGCDATLICYDCMDNHDCHR